MKRFSLALILLVVVSCSCTRDITLHPASMTDFEPGRVYTLLKPAWSWGGVLVSKEPPDSEGYLPPGTTLAVRKIVVDRGFEVGTRTDVFAEVLTGDLKGKMVDLVIISHSSNNGYTKRDPEILEPVEIKKN